LREERDLGERENSFINKKYKEEREKVFDF
jgi:hypothetical protein